MLLLAESDHLSVIGKSRLFLTNMLFYASKMEDRDGLNFIESLTTNGA